MAGPAVWPGGGDLTLPLTGERTVPGVWYENYWFQRHLAAYEHVLKAGLGRLVLEAGCGEGYGATLLAEGSEAVFALDYDAATVAHVGGRHPQIPVLRANLVALPFRDQSLDAVVSLQTLEHLWDQDSFVAEGIRVLRPGGALVVSTPNRLTFSPGLAHGQKPRNPFHTTELDPGELTSLLAGYATIDAITGLRHGTTIDRWEQTRGSLVDAQLASPYPEWDDELASLVSALTVDDFSVAAEDLPTSLDLIAFVTAPRTRARHAGSVLRGE